MMGQAPLEPELLYDGDCGFCGYWVRYWQRLTGDKVRYRPFQEALPGYTDLSAEECQRAVQLLEPDGRRSSGAEASFRVLAYGGCGVYAAVMSRSQWVKRAAEATYTFVSRRRESAAHVARALWGPERYPARYDVTSAIFIRIIALIYVSAFASLALQITGLIGADGILPASNFFDAVAQAIPQTAWLRVPSLLWLAHSDAVLVGACLAGATAALVAAAGFLRVTSLIVCYVLYLSLYGAGQEFMSFQWDLLLLEAGFLAIFLPVRSAVVPWLFRLMLFRFMFLSGCVKLLSGDPSWAALSALDFHYETQPLPTPIAWYVHQLPHWFHRACVAGTFVIELAFPFLIFTARRPRMLAAIGFLSLELLILITGNYNFFNFLTIALCLFLIDDAQFRRLPRLPKRNPTPVSTPARLLIGALACVLILLNAFYLLRPFTVRPMPEFVVAVIRPFVPFHITNGYGLFAVMTPKRPEIEVQGSYDGRDWVAYEFRYKPGDLSVPPRWNIPHQPRLDWQMWFAALSNAERQPWFANFLFRLLQNTPDVTELLKHNPFSETPPRYVRAMLYDYRFSTVEERKSTGRVWQRQPLGLYHPAIRLP